MEDTFHLIYINVHTSVYTCTQRYVHTYVFYCFAKDVQPDHRAIPLTGEQVLMKKRTGPNGAPFPLVAGTLVRRGKESQNSEPHNTLCVSEIC